MFFLNLYNKKTDQKKLDPLDPLTEIINEAKLFSSWIALEKILWVMIGFFLLGAISTSITREMKQNNWFGNKSFLSGLKVLNEEDKLPNELSDEDK